MAETQRHASNGPLASDVHANLSSARAGYRDPLSYDEKLDQFNKGLDKVTPRGKGEDDSGGEKPHKGAADDEPSNKFQFGSAYKEAPENAHGVIAIDSLKEYVDKNKSKYDETYQQRFFNSSLDFYENPQKSPSKKVINVDLKKSSKLKSEFSLSIIPTSVGCVPIVTTYYDTNEQGTDKVQTNFEKKITIYDCREKVPSVEGARAECPKLFLGDNHSFVIDHRIHDDNMKNKDVSFLYFDRFILFYRRKGNTSSTLELVSVDVTDRTVEVLDFDIEEPNKDTLYHPMFSTEFGSRVNKDTYRLDPNSESDPNKQLREFVKKQFVFLQVYSQKPDGQTDRGLPQLNPVNLICYSMKDMASSEPVETQLSRLPIQCVVHHCPDPKTSPQFIAFDSFSSYHFEMENGSFELIETFPCNTDEHLSKYGTRIIRGDISPGMYKKCNEEGEYLEEYAYPFLKHLNSQFLIQKLQVQDNDVLVDQWFYITNENQIMLISPNFKDLEMKQHRIFALSKQLFNSGSKNYEKDFEKRKLEHVGGKVMKVSHVSQDPASSMSHLNDSETLKRILKFKDEQGKGLNFQHRIVISTDNKSSVVYVFKPADSIGEPDKNYSIQLDSYDKNTDHVKKAKTLAEQIYKIKQKPQDVSEIIRFDDQQISPQISPYKQSFYINKSFKGVVSSHTHIQGGNLEYSPQKRNRVIVEMEDGKYICLKICEEVLDTGVLKVKKINEQDSIDVHFQMYHKNERHYVFFFTMTNQLDPNDQKNTYFAVKVPLNDHVVLSKIDYLLKDDTPITVFTTHDEDGKDYIHHSEEKPNVLTERYEDQLEETKSLWRYTQETTYKQLKTDISESKKEDESKPKTFQDQLKLFSEGDVNIKSIYSQQKSYDKLKKATNHDLLHERGSPYFHYKMYLPEAPNQSQHLDIKGISDTNSKDGGLLLQVTGMADDEYDKEISDNMIKKIKNALEGSPTNCDVNLIFEQCLDNRNNINFMPIIYQQRGKASHQLLIFDTYQMKVVRRSNIMSHTNLRQILRESDTGFVQYAITRTSNVTSQKKCPDNTESEFGLPESLEQIVKYQVTTPYTTSLKMPTSVTSEEQKKSSNGSPKQLSEDKKEGSNGSDSSFKNKSSTFIPKLDLGKVKNGATDSDDINGRMSPPPARKEDKCEESCFIELTEYVVKYKCSIEQDKHKIGKNKLNMIGKKWLLVSPRAIRNCGSFLNDLMMIPYINPIQEKTTGCQFVVKKEQEGSLKALNLLDQDMNTLYQYSTKQTVQYGHKKFFLSDKNGHPDEFILVVSSQLKRKTYMSSNDLPLFDNSEVYWVLSKVIKKVLSMKLASFEDLLLNSNKDVDIARCYMPQEVLHGMSVNDISQQSTSVVAANLHKVDSNYEAIEKNQGSLIYEFANLYGIDEDLTKQNIEKFEKIQLCELNMLINTDFNFSSTLRIAGELNQNANIQRQLDFIFDLDQKAFKSKSSGNKVTFDCSMLQDILMFDFPKLLEFPRQERIYPFLGRDQNEIQQIEKEAGKSLRNNQPYNSELLNFEDFIYNPKLAQYQKEEVVYIVKERFKDFHRSKEEVIDDLAGQYPNVAGPQLNIEVQHSYIDFQHLIIGEKIRGSQEKNGEKVVFNDNHLAKIFHVQPHPGPQNEDRLEFYNLEVTRKVIDYQFIKTKGFLIKCFKGYLFGFLIPFTMTLSIESAFLLNLLYTLCLFTQFFLIIFEWQQLREQKWDYFKDGWNLMDSSQFFLFLGLYLIKIVSQFQTDSMLEIILQLVLLFQCFYKAFYFIRLWEKCAFIVSMSIEIIKDTSHFLILMMILMVAFCKQYTAMHVSVSDPSGKWDDLEMPFFKLLFQTFSSNSGDKNLPILDDAMATRMDGSPGYQNFLSIFIYFVWILQQAIFAFSFFYFIAMVTQSYEKNYPRMVTLMYKTKAQFNDECYDIMDIFYQQTNFKVLLFSIDKNLRQKQDAEWQGTAYKAQEIKKSLEEVHERSDEKIQQLSSEISEIKKMLSDMVAANQGRH